jgi:hypothetical protein
VGIEHIDDILGDLDKRWMWLFPGDRIKPRQGFYKHYRLAFGAAFSSNLEGPKGACG